MNKSLSALLVLLASCTSVFAREETPELVSASRLQDIPLHAPVDGAAKAMVVYFSDISGWTASDDAAVNALIADGDAVLAVDLARYAQTLNADAGQCLYVVGEITDLAQTAQRTLNIQTYLPPVVAGRGQGATFAYAALADAPANTLGGAVGYDFDNQLDLEEHFCPGATATKTADGKGFSYSFDRPLPAPARLFVKSDLTDQVREEASARENLVVGELEASDGGADQIASAVSELSQAANPFGEIPAIDLPAQGKPRALAVFISGDGGWRDLDKTMGEWLATQNIHVVGLDALHYFWAKRTPQELAHDIEQLVNEADPAKDLPVMLIGYSFGADTQPFAYPLLPQSIQDRTRLLALMAPGLSTSFQVTISGWLGIDDSGYEIVPAIARLPKERVMCVYGEEEDASACKDPSLSGMTIIKTKGGHYFDGNYPALAQRFLDRLG